MKTQFRHLSAVFILAVLTVAAAIPVMAGTDPYTVGAALGICVASAFLIKPVPKLNHDQRRAVASRLRMQYGKIGDDTALDANETAFFERQLEFVKAKTYDIKYAELKAISLIPVSTEAGSGAQTITYYTYDQTGIAKLIASYADDLPRSDITGKRNTADVHSIGTSYGYNIQEIRAAMMAGLPLQQRKSNAARRSNDQKVNTLAFFGDTEANLPGFLNNVNVTRGTLPNDGAAAATTFVSKTPDQILRDLNSGTNGPFILTLGVETANIKLLPLAQYQLIYNTPRSATTDTSIGEWFMGNNPFMKAGGRIEWVNECKAAGTLGGNKDVMVDYRMDSDHLTLELPQPFEQFPPQERNLEYVIPCHSRIGGVLMYYPLSMNVSEGC